MQGTERVICKALPFAAAIEIERCHSVVNYILSKEIALGLQTPSKSREIKYKIMNTVSWHTQTA